MKKEMLRIVKAAARTPIELRMINMEVYEGEIVGVTGLDDCSYMYLLSVLENPAAISAGTVIRKGKIGIIKGGNPWNLFDRFSVSENVCVFGGNKPALRLIRQADYYNETEELFAAAGIDILPDTTVRELSCLQKVLVLIMKNIHEGKNIIVIDSAETFLAGRDFKELIELCYRVVKAFACSIIVISGEALLAQKLCMRTYIIRNGYTVYCLGKNASVSSRVINYEKIFRESADSIQRMEDGQRTLIMQIQGDCPEHSLPVRIDICRGEMTGILDIGGKCCSNLADYIAGKKNKGDWQISRFEAEEEKAKGGGVRIFRDRILSYDFPHMSLKRNLSLSILKNVTGFGGVFVSSRMEDVIMEEFEQELLEFSIPLPKGADVRYSELALEQKVCAAFYKLRLQRPAVLIIDHSLFYRQTSIGNVLVKCLGKILSCGIAVLIIDNNVGELYNCCTNKYLFVEGRYRGMIEEDFKVSEELLQ